MSTQPSPETNKHDKDGFVFCELKSMRRRHLSPPWGRATVGGEVGHGKADTKTRRREIIKVFHKHFKRLFRCKRRDLTQTETGAVKSVNTLLMLRGTE